MTAASAAEQANLDCTCVTLDRAALLQQLEAETGRSGFGATLVQTHPHLFAASPVFLAGTTLAAMQRVVDAVEAVARTPAYQRVRNPAPKQAEPS